ncbi:MAG TPA: hypothetical protein PKC59_03845 [Burkholderiaceae bacterium]|nr:hypothetical protein [Burkholderiaceae bacterium]HMY98033.1 hypothetical protein [Burkholderiaceae bacterium]HNG77978.1 hypothetical protein [Burkholderiaceae bacterium]
MRAELGPGRVAGSYACLSLAEVTLADGSTRTYQVMRSARFDAKQLGEALIALGWQVVATVPYDSRSASMILRRA